MLVRFVLLLSLLIVPRPVLAADQPLIAVATNFLPCAETLAKGFETATGIRIRLASGSTGKLAAQIETGAPYDAFLAADQTRPARLEALGFTVIGSRFTYATGRLALWSAEPGRIGADPVTTLTEGRFRRIAMANPALAPYGRASVEVLAALGLTKALASHVVLGENVGQARTLVATGNAELGFVALAGLGDPAALPPGSVWVVPGDLHSPIRQDAVLLVRGDPDGAAAGFLDHLRSTGGRAIIVGCGYEATP